MRRAFDPRWTCHKPGVGGAAQHGPLTRTRPWLAAWLAGALVVACGRPAVAAPDPDGAYGLLAGGAALIRHDCGFYLDCDRASAGAVRVALGWQQARWFGEAWLLRVAEATVGDAFVQRRLKLSGWGGAAGWRLPLTEQSEARLRLGLLSMRHERSGNGVNTSVSPLVGVAWARRWTPNMALELSWDFTTAEGNQIGSTLVQFVTVGVRWSN